MFLLRQIFWFLLCVFSTCSAQCRCPGSEWLSQPMNISYQPFVRRTINLEDPAWNYKLPTSLLPIHYDLIFRPEIFPPFQLNGEVKILFRCLEETQKVILHSLQQQVYNFRVMQENNRQVLTIKNVAFDHEKEFLILTLQEKLIKGNYYNLHLVFEGHLNVANFTGFAITYYYVGEKIRYVAVTKFEPVYARTAFPCFDEPHLKATFTITIFRQFNMTSLSNMPIKESTPRSDGWIEDKFEKSSKMSTYTVALTVSDFDYIAADAKDLLIRAWARPNAVHLCQTAVSTVPQMLRFLEDFLGVPHGLRKLDLFAVPNVKFGAMENWGLITFAEENLLHNSRNKETLQYYNILKVIAHELAHQWFGNMVTMKWWNDIWLNEGLSTYIGELVYENVIYDKPKWHFTLSAKLVLSTCVHEMEPERSSLSYDAIGSSNILGIFDKFMYDKGFVIMKMIESFVGKEATRKALTSYLLANRFSNVRQDDLWFHLSKEFNQLNVKEIMDPWTLQTGFPIITVTRNYRNHSIVITQKIFISKQVKHKINTTTKWIVPLTFTTQKERHFQDKRIFWLNQKDEFLTLNEKDGIPGNDEWVLFNPSVTGYYLVNYDIRNWQLILNELILHHTRFPATVRLHLVQSLQILLQNEVIPSYFASLFMEYIRKERDEVILVEASSLIYEFIYIFRSTPHFDIFQKYLRYFITPIWNFVNFELGSVSDYNENYRFFLVRNIYKISCAAGIENCINAVEDMLMAIFDANKFDDSERYKHLFINQETVCSVIRDLPVYKWEKLWSRRRNVNVTEHQIHFSFLGILSCTSNQKLLYRILSEVFTNSSNRPNESHRSSIIRLSVQSDYFNRQFTFNFVQKKLMALPKASANSLTYKEDLHYLFKHYSAYINSRSELEDFEQFLSCVPRSFFEREERTYVEMMNILHRQVKERERIISEKYKWLTQAIKSLLSTSG